MTTTTTSTINHDSDAMIFAHVIFRHGHRNALESFPNDPYEDEEKYWPEGYGQLTNKGKRQQYELGQYFRRRYGKLLGPKYSVDKVYVRSTDFDRCIMSAQANLAGLFPPTGDQKWSDDILWQPIPVHTVPWKMDHVVGTGRPFPRFEAAREKYLKEDPEIQKKLADHADLLKELTEKSGEDVKTIADVFYLHNTLWLQKDKNLPLPDWAEKAVEPNGVVERIAESQFKVNTATPEMARLKSGFLIKEMMERFTSKIFDDLEPDRVLWLYSAHDETIANMLNSLGLFELHAPPFACSLHFELYKPNKNEHYLQIFYRKCNEEYPEPLKLPGCGDRFTMDQFYDLYEHLIPDEFEKECNLR
ncbi:hypothetical protein HA402_014523 [Bradysia odoriphaga]|nr:hypothetical protein HA402_014523 [Bradysia odoriphaga]